MSLPRRSRLARCARCAGPAVLVVALWGCGATTRSPESTLHNYAQALREGQVKRAYEFMSAEFRAGHSFEQFGAMIDANPEEVRQTAERLAVEEGTIEIQAELQLAFDETIRLRKEGGQWRIVGNPLAFYSQETPRNTVRSFVRAYRLKRWDVMLRFVPDLYRERMSEALVKEQFEGAKKEQMREMMETLEVNLSSPRVDSQEGDQARLAYGEDYQVQLIRQGGIWKIKSL